MENKQALDNWLYQEEYLPDFLKVQENKQLLTDMILKKMELPKEYVGKYLSVQFREYSFGMLRFAAMCGYSLKKSHHRSDFINFEDELKELEELKDTTTPIAPSAHLRKWLIRDMDNPFYLPVFMKDFHDAKDFFRLYERETGDTHLDKITGHVYCSDFFLFFLARFGYFLRRSNKKLDFSNLDFLLAKNKQKEVDVFLKMLK